MDKHGLKKRPGAETAIFISLDGRILMNAMDFDMQTRGSFIPPASSHGHRFAHKPGVGGGFSPPAFGSAANAGPPANGEDASIWRDTALRYGGYADEVGEFASPYLGGIGRFVGYGVSTAYCIADMFITTLPRKYQDARDSGLPVGQSIQKTLLAGLDLGLFHGIATLWIPPMLIGGVVEACDQLLDRESGHAPTTGGDPLRRTLSRGMDKLIRPIRAKTSEAVDGWLESKGAQWVSGRPLASANLMLQRYRGGLEKGARFFAHLASACERIPGLKSVIGAAELHQNATDIGIKQGFCAKELAKLLFIKPIPVAVGIAMVPLIAHPFDRLTEKGLDWTVRPLTGKNRLEKGLDGQWRTVRNRPASPLPTLPVRAANPPFFQPLAFRSI